MKSLLIFPPLWPPMAPYLALPTLVGQLRNEGFDAESLDLNIEFYNDILNKSYLKQSVKKLIKIEKETKKTLQSYEINK